MQHFPITEKLHTDVLEERYGPITAKVIKQNSTIRESLLVDSKGIARTYALTFIEKTKDKEIEKINEKIKTGEAIGKAFREKGYSIRKNVLDVFIISLPSWVKEEFKTKESNAKARLSEFYAKKEGKKPVIYGIVVEVYTPDFRKPVIHEIDKLQVSAVTSCLEAEGSSKEDVWKRVGEENNYEDSQERYKSAKQKSRAVVSKLREKVEKEMRTPR